MIGGLPELKSENNRLITLYSISITVKVKCIHTQQNYVQ